MFHVLLRPHKLSLQQTGKFRSAGLYKFIATAGNPQEESEREHSIKKLLVTLSRCLHSSAVCSTYCQTFCFSLDDHSRVVLNTVENLDESDYVNANYIDVGLFFFYCSSSLHNAHFFQKQQCLDKLFQKLCQGMSFKFYFDVEVRKSTSLQQFRVL